MFHPELDGWDFYHFYPVPGWQIDIAQSDTAASGGQGEQIGMKKGKA